MGDSHRNRIEKEVPILRAEVGDETVQAAAGGYRLTVRVYRAPLEDPKVEEPVPKTQPTPAEARSEEVSKRAGPELSAGRPLRHRASLVLSFALSVIVPLALWWLTRHGSQSASRYGLAAVAVALVAVGFYQLRLRVSRQVTILVAQLGDDEHAKKMRQIVMKSIDQALGPGVAKIRPLEERLSASIEVEEQSRREVPSWLKKTNGDILLWGDLYTPAEMKDHFDLRFSTPNFDHSPQRKFKFDDSCTLESDFVPELGTAIAAIAVAMAFPNLRNSPPFAARVLEPAAAKLSKLAEDVHLFHAVDRGTVLHAYGYLESIIGGHYGDDVRLDRAVAALRSATVELDRARVPRSWAQAQNSLGVALGRYSDQRVGTDLLIEAESALQAALTELDAGRAPSERAKTFHHLGLIQTRIGARQSSPEHDTNAIASFREAIKLVQGRPRVAAIVENSLASALIGLGTRNGDDGCLEEALALTSHSVDLFELPLNLYGWTVSMIAYADAARALGVRRGSVGLIKEALRAFRLVSRVKTRRPHHRIGFNFNLPSA